jgi:protein arginine N-methyltransferase 5
MAQSSFPTMHGFISSVAIGLSLRDMTHAGFLAKALSEAFASNFDFVAVPLVRTGLRRDEEVVLPSGARAPSTFSDKELSPGQWSTSVLGVIQTFPFLSSPDTNASKGSEGCDTLQSVASQCAIRTAQNALAEELDWATHLGLSAVLLPQLRRTSECLLYSRAINVLLQNALAQLHLWLEVPLVPLWSKNNTNKTKAAATTISSSSPSSDETGIDINMTLPDTTSDVLPGAATSWETWNRMRCLCDQSPRLHACLVLTSALPSRSELGRWMGEPVKGVIVPTSVFLQNKKGFPVLPARHQEFLVALFDYNVQFVVRPSDPSLSSSALVPYMQYLLHLETRRPPVTAEEAYTREYYDYLQEPLQPLMDNLESATYDTFEKDPIKYAQYEKAVRKAIQSLRPELAEKAGTAGDPICIMVVGAGRGPLVRASLSAADSLGQPVRVYAVEKNPNAVITLRHMALGEAAWRDRVTVIAGDMRQWEAPEQCDILVSELLGSFGDNELSPECLDGMQRFLKPGTGISIPQDYTSYLAPITSQKLWNAANAYGDRKHLETQYVCRLHNISTIAPAKRCFYFAHPNHEFVDAKGTPDNSRYTNIQFSPAESSALLHGFAGYFESTLFDDVMISILPRTKSRGMYSWFPLLVPLRHPLFVKKGDVVTVDMWRCTSPQKVWYTWAASTPDATSPLHNPNGRSQFVGL